LAEGKGFGTNRWAPGGGAEPFARLGEHACPAGGAFLPRKVAKEFLRDKIVIAFGVAEPFARLGEHACPVGDSLRSPVGVAEFYKRYSFVRLPGVGLLFCEEK
jgi:hypothetical protein